MQAQTSSAHDVMNWIREGTPVYDRDRLRIGTVKYVQNNERIDHSIVEQLSVADQVRLLQTGFIQIDCGIMWPKRYATSAQIAALDEDGLWLNVRIDDLVIA